MPTKTMSLARIGPASLFLGLWTPVVALAIVWATAASGAPILFALEHVGVDRLDRPAVAIALAPPLPYLFALVALSAGMAARRLSASYALPERARRALVLTWLATGVLLSSTAPLSLYAEHGTANEPLDEVHLALWLATWAWWSITASGIAVALALRGHAAVVLLASRSRAVGGTALGLGVLSLSMASVVVVPSAAREPIDEWVPVVDAVGTQTESIVLALAADVATPVAGAPAGPGASSSNPGVGDSDDENPSPVASPSYTAEECIKTLEKAPLHNAIARLEHRYPGIDAEDVAWEAALAICLDESRRTGDLTPLLKTIAERRAISRLRRRSTADRNEPGLVQMFGTSVDAQGQLDARALLRCMLEDETDKDLVAAMMSQKFAPLTQRGMSAEAARKAIERGWKRAATRSQQCGGPRLH